MSDDLSKAPDFDRAISAITPLDATLSDTLTNLTREFAEWRVKPPDEKMKTLSKSQDPVELLFLQAETVIANIVACSKVEQAASTTRVLDSWTKTQCAMRALDPICSNPNGLNLKMGYHVWINALVSPVCEALCVVSLPRTQTRWVPTLPKAMRSDPLAVESLAVVNEARGSNRNLMGIAPLLRFVSRGWKKRVAPSSSAVVVTNSKMEEARLRKDDLDARFAKLTAAVMKEQRNKVLDLNNPNVVKDLTTQVVRALEHPSVLDSDEVKQQVKELKDTKYDRDLVAVATEITRDLAPRLVPAVAGIGGGRPSYRDALNKTNNSKVPPTSETFENRERRRKLMSSAYSLAAATISASSDGGDRSKVHADEEDLFRESAKGVFGNLRNPLKTRLDQVTVSRRVTSLLKDHQEARREMNTLVEARVRAQLHAERCAKKDKDSVFYWPQPVLQQAHRLLIHLRAACHHNPTTPGGWFVGATTPNEWYGVLTDADRVTAVEFLDAATARVAQAAMVGAEEFYSTENRDFPEVHVLLALLPLNHTARSPLPGLYSLTSDVLASAPSSVSALRKQLASGADAALQKNEDYRHQLALSIARTRVLGALLIVAAVKVVGKDASIMDLASVNAEVAEVCQAYAAPSQAEYVIHMFPAVLPKMDMDKMFMANMRSVYSELTQIIVATSYLHLRLMRLSAHMIAMYCRTVFNEVLPREKGSKPSVLYTKSTFLGELKTACDHMSHVAASSTLFKDKFGRILDGAKLRSGQNLVYSKEDAKALSAVASPFLMQIKPDQQWAPRHFSRRDRFIVFKARMSGSDPYIVEGHLRHVYEEFIEYASRLTHSRYGYGRGSSSVLDESVFRPIMNMYSKFVGQLGAQLDSVMKSTPFVTSFEDTILERYQLVDCAAKEIDAKHSEAGRLRHALFLARPSDVDARLKITNLKRITAVESLARACLPQFLLLGCDITDARYPIPSFPADGRLRALSASGSWACASLMSHCLYSD